MTVNEAVEAFVSREREGWSRLEALLQTRLRRPLLLAEVREVDRLYRHTSRDLAVAQGRYPNTRAHLFLNQLCAQAYSTLYRPERGGLKALVEFFRRDFPRAFLEKRRAVALSAGLMAFGALLGASLVIADPRQAEWLVPAPIIAAIAEHRMWTDSLLITSTPGLVAAGIATNNLTVMILSFGSGLMLGAGPVYILLTNGLLLGAVVAQCLRAGMGQQLLTFICAQGPVELSTLILAGGAGLSLGQALVNPGELPRRVTLKREAIQGVKLVLGAAPFLAGIGLVEGFISPGHLFTPWLKGAVGLGLGAGFWTYLVFYARSRTAAGTE